MVSFWRRFSSLSVWKCGNLNVGKLEAGAPLSWAHLSITLAFRSLVIKTCLIEDRSRCSGCQKAKCCSIVRTISSCLGNKEARGSAFHFAALGGTELSSRADSEGVKPWCVAVNPSLCWPLCTRGFPYIFQMNYRGPCGPWRTWL